MILRNLIFLNLLLSLFSCREKQKELRPETKQLTEAVYASGNLVPQNEYKVIASAEGYLSQAYVQEGAEVKKGQQLFFISSATRNANLTTGNPDGKQDRGLNRCLFPAHQKPVQQSCIN
jgi:multidrug efflux pump subunit AcrA (membrane-fusion protein)